MKFFIAAFKRRWVGHGREEGYTVAVRKTTHHWKDSHRPHIDGCDHLPCTESFMATQSASRLWFGCMGVIAVCCSFKSYFNPPPAFDVGCAIEVKPSPSSFVVGHGCVFPGRTSFTVHLPINAAPVQVVYIPLLLLSFRAQPSVSSVPE